MQINLANITLTPASAGQDLGNQSEKTAFVQFVKEMIVQFGPLLIYALANRGADLRAPNITIQSPCSSHRLINFCCSGFIRKNER